MPRLSRICPVGIPQHIIQRGNNRQVCFNCNDDMTAYANWLVEYAKKIKRVRIFFNIAKLMERAIKNLDKIIEESEKK